MLKIEINGKELRLVKKAKEKIADLVINVLDHVQDCTEELKWKAEAFSYYSGIEDSNQDEKQQMKKEMYEYGNYAKPGDYGGYETEEPYCGAWMFCDPDNEEKDIDGQMHFEETPSEKCSTRKWENSAIPEDEKFSLAQYLELTSIFNPIINCDEQSIREYCEEIGFPVSKYSMKVFEKSENLKNKEYYDTGWYGMQRLLKEAFPDEDAAVMLMLLKGDFSNWMNKRPDIKKHCNRPSFRLLVFHFLSRRLK